MPSVKITENNDALETLARSWVTAEYTSVDSIGSMGSLHEAGDALVALALVGDDGSTILGSGVMISPGLAMVATHVLDEFEQRGEKPVLITFLPDGTRAWLSRQSSTASGPSAYGVDRRIVSDVSLLTCTLNSEALTHHPLMLAPIRVGLPLMGERLWAFGYRHNGLEDAAALVTPLVTSGLVTAVYPHGRGERMPAPCVEVEMDTLGGMSGGPVVNAAGELVGIVSSSIEGGPSYVTLVWDALRFKFRSTLPWLENRGDIDLFTLRDLNLAKVMGDVARRPRGDVTLSLSEEEGELMAASVDPAKVVRPPPGFTMLSKSDLEALSDQWLSKLEQAAEHAALSCLSELELHVMKQCLVVSGIPHEILSSVSDFSIEDFEGIEDPDLFSGLEGKDGTVSLSLSFQLRSVICTLQVSTADYLARKEDYSKHFYNFQVDNATTKMDFIQGFYFEASLDVDVKNQSITQESITTLGVLRRRNRTDSKGRELD